MENVESSIIFPNIPAEVWKKLYPRILENYKEKIKEHFLQSGEAYLREHRSDNNEFYGLNATLKRLPLVIMDLLEDCEINEADPNLTKGSLTYTGDWNIVDVSFTDVEWFMLRDVFKVVKFVDENKPNFDTFYYDCVCKLCRGSYGAHILTAYSNLLTPVPVDNNEEGARQLEAKLRKKFPDL